VKEVEWDVINDPYGYEGEGVIEDKFQKKILLDMETVQKIVCEDLPGHVTGKLDKAMVFSYENGEIIVVEVAKTMEIDPVAVKSKSTVFHEFVHATGAGEAVAYGCELAVYGAETPESVEEFLKSEVYVYLHYDNYFAPDSLLPVPGNYPKSCQGLIDYATDEVVRFKKMQQAYICTDNPVEGEVSKEEIKKIKAEISEIVSGWEVDGEICPIKVAVDP
jgi:hypothetical protein